MEHGIAYGIVSEIIILWLGLHGKIRRLTGTTAEHTNSTCTLLSGPSSKMLPEKNGASVVVACFVRGSV